MNHELRIMNTMNNAMPAGRQELRIKGWLGLSALTFTILGVLLFHNDSNDVFAACNPPTGSPTMADLVVTAPTFTGKFYSTDQVCIIADTVSLDTSRVPNYEKLKTDYYILPSSALKREITSAELSAHTAVVVDKNVLHTTENFSVSSISGTGVAIIFVDKNLEITSNIAYGKGDITKGLVFVVAGNVYIRANVTEINAAIISEGTIYTAAQLGSSCDTSSVSSSQLVINGSFISINTLTPIKFCRTLTNNDNPAEVLNHQSKYLILLRNIFSESFQKWSEIP